MVVGENVIFQLRYHYDLGSIASCENVIFNYATTVILVPIASCENVIFQLRYHCGLSPMASCVQNKYRAVASKSKRQTMPIYSNKKQKQKLHQSLKIISSKQLVLLLLLCLFICRRSEIFEEMFPARDRSKAFVKNIWLVFVASMGVQACAGIGYLFGSISPVIKSAMGYNQRQIAILVVG